LISVTIGSAVKKALEEKGHEVVSVGRKSGDCQADISEPESLRTLFGRIGSFDAVANAAGDSFPGPPCHPGGSRSAKGSRHLDRLAPECLTCVAMPSRTVQSDEGGNPVAMPITIPLDLEERLLNQAQAEGLSVQQYLDRLLREQEEWTD
jgi:hypothetical protein